MIRSCSLKLQQICVPAGMKQTIFTFIFFYFWAGRYNKTLNDWLRGKQWVLFPLELNITRGEENSEGLGGKNSLFPSRPVIKYLFDPFHMCSGQWKKTDLILQVEYEYKFSANFKLLKGLLGVAYRMRCVFDMTMWNLQSHSYSVS